MTWKAVVGVKLDRQGRDQVVRIIAETEHEFLQKDHNLTCWSREPDTKNMSSPGWNLTPVTKSRRGKVFFKGCGLSICHNLTVLSIEEVTRKSFLDQSISRTS